MGFNLALGIIHGPHRIALRSAWMAYVTCLGLVQLPLHPPLWSFDPLSPVQSWMDMEEQLAIDYLYVHPRHKDGSEGASVFSAKGQFQFPPKNYMFISPRSTSNMHPYEHMSLHGYNDRKSTLCLLFCCLSYYKHSQCGNRSFIIVVQSAWMEKIRDVLSKQQFGEGGGNVNVTTQWVF